MTTVHHTNHLLGAGPRWLLGIRIAQLVIAVIILGLVAYSASQITGPAIDGAYGVNLFTAAATLIINIWLIVSILSAPLAYNMWANLATEIFLTVFWLISFAILGAYSADLQAGGLDYGGFLYNITGYIPWQTGAAAAGLGGLEFILFVISIVVLGIFLHKARVGTVGGPATGGPVGGNTYQGAPVTQEAKYQTGPVQEAGLQQQQQQQYQPQQQIVGHPPVQHQQQQQQPYVSPTTQHVSPQTTAASTTTSGAGQPAYSAPEAVPQQSNFNQGPVSTQY